MPLPSTGLVVWTTLFGTVFYGLFVFIRFFLRTREKNQFAKNFSNRDKHWLLGNLHEFPGPSEAGLTWMKERSAEIPDGIAIFWMGPFYPAVNVFLPETAKIILKTSEPKAVQIGTYFNLLPWLGDGLLLAGGKKWERNRRLLTPAFHFDILRPYMVVNNRCTDILINKLEKFAERNEFFEVFTHISLLTLDIILRCAFSYDNDCQLRGESHPYVKAVNSLGEAAVDRTLKPWLYPDFVFYLSPLGRRFKKDCDFVHSVSEEVIKTRREALGRLGTDSVLKHRYLDFVDILLTAKDADGQGLTDQEIRDEADTFLFEGHDTTSSGISWTFYSLAKHPEHLKRCQEEVDEVLKYKTNKDIEWDDLPKLKYLTMCIKESLRLHTTVPIIQRQTTKEITIAGKHIPAGVMVNIQLYVMHHLERTWTDAEEFRPDRFSHENMDKMDPYAFCPFSAGPRNCIGQHFAMHEIKTILAKVISRFDLSLDPSRTVKERLGLVMKSEDGIYMKATPRMTT